MKSIFLLIILISTACITSKQKSTFQTLDFGLFSIEAPCSWRKLKTKGVDSYVGRIAIDSNDTLHFDVGWYSNSLSSEEQRERYSFDTIDGYEAKIVCPKQSGFGYTGIYIQSLWRHGLEKSRFNLYGTNLKPSNEKGLLTAIKTLKFHKKEH